MKIIKAECPHCGAPVTVKLNEKKGHCDYCDSNFVLDELDIDEFNPVESRHGLIRTLIHNPEIVIIPFFVIVCLIMMLAPVIFGR